MKEISRVHLAKVSYDIELDAKQELAEYFEQLRQVAGDESIFDDVEIRVTEILHELGVEKNGVITTSEVVRIKTQLGDPEVFSDAEVEPVDSKKSEDIKSEDKNSSFDSERRIYRDKFNGVLGGVASGLAAYFKLDVVIVRLIMIAAILLSVGWVIPLYIVSWIVIPRAKNASDILRMRGEKITAPAIREVNEQYDFEKMSKNSEAWTKIFRYLFGSGFALGAIGALAVLVVVNVTYWGPPGEFYRYHEYTHLSMFLASLAGVSLVVFFGIISYSLFTGRIKSSQIIALVALCLVGITSFTASVYNLTYHSNISSQIIENSLTKRVIEQDSEALSAIKTLNIASQRPITIGYIVSSTSKIEVYGYSIGEGQHRVNPKISYNESALNLSLENDSYKINSNEWFIMGGPEWLDSSEKITIYGPALESVKLQDSLANLTYQGNNQDKLEISLADSASMRLEGNGTINNLSAIMQQSSSLIGEKIKANNLIIKTDDQASIDLHSAENVDIQYDGRCRALAEVDSYYTDQRLASITLGFGDLSKVKLNGSLLGDSNISDCLNIKIDHNI